MDLQKLFGLDGRVALVTGGSRGIGLMIARGLLAAGCARVYLAARKQGELDEAVAALGDRAVGIAADVSTLAGIEALAQDIAAHEPLLDILVNNAGAAWGAPFGSFPESGWDKVVDLNLKAPFFLTQALHGLLAAAASAERPAKVINIASIDGRKLNPWETYSYQASKAGLIQLTKRMAARLIADRIVVSAIAPGAFPSAMNKAARDTGDAVAQAIPAGRVGTAEDMAAAAIYLASRAGDYVVGSTLTVDGGLVDAALPADLGNPDGS
ncbi:MAG: SDR family oxidoreductase [Novosphingobium sp.]|nr:SDR family oxidoreductase [Novosphingobium sp.]MBO9603972.1 SDR family oxidoreductase [Novosphingobium sp.]